MSGLSRAGRSAPGWTRAPLLTGRRAAVLLAALSVMGTSACATKRDVRDLRVELRDQMAIMRTQQDSILGVLHRQQQAILDSLVQTTGALLQVRGDLSHELTQLQQQLEQVQALTGQVQAQLNQYQHSVDARMGQGSGGQVQAQTQGTQSSAPATAQGAGTDAQQYYDIGIEQRNRGNLDTARRAFQTVVDSFPKDPLAPQAQRQVAETYYLQEKYDDALKALDRLVQRWGDSPQAAEALYRAGMIAKEQGNNQRAQEYFKKLVAAYPQSDAAGLARKELGQTGG
ncbi:MAG: tetratricopeptide repeat protein [Gemmatimonadota bacterium]